MSLLDDYDPFLDPEQRRQADYAAMQAEYRRLCWWEDYVLAALYIALFLGLSWFTAVGDRYRHSVNYHTLNPTIDIAQTKGGEK